MEYFHILLCDVWIRLRQTGDRQVIVDDDINESVFYCDLMMRLSSSKSDRREKFEF